MLSGPRASCPPDGAVPRRVEGKSGQVQAFFERGQRDWRDSAEFPEVTQGLVQASGQTAPAGKSSRELQFMKQGQSGSVT